MNSPQRSLALGLAMLAGAACSATDNVDPPGYLFSGGTDGLSTTGPPKTGGRTSTSAAGGGTKGTGGARSTGGRAGTGGRRSPLT